MGLRTIVLMATSCIVILGGAASTSYFRSKETSKPPYAADVPLIEPKIFAEGIVSTDTDEFGATFAPDGQTVFFSKSAPLSNIYVICFSRFEKGKWSTPQVAPFSGQYWDFDPVLSPDGSRLFFGSDRPVPGKQKQDNDFDIWMVEKTSRGWSDPKNLGPAINSAADETFASVSADGTLYFVSNRPPGADTQPFSIYRSRLIKGAYTEAEKLSGDINLPINSGLEVVIAPDESFLLLSPFGHPESYGSIDIYISYSNNGVWSAPKNLGPRVNSRARDYSPRLSPDGKYLFFTSERGFATNMPLDRQLTYEEFEAKMKSALNGWGNIYQIDLSALEKELGNR